VIFEPCGKLLQIVFCGRAQFRLDGGGYPGRWRLPDPRPEDCSEVHSSVLHLVDVGAANPLRGRIGDEAGPLQKPVVNDLAGRDLDAFPVFRIAGHPTDIPAMLIVNHMQPEFLHVGGELVEIRPKIRDAWPVGLSDR